VRLGEGDQLVVGVDRLRGLPGVDADRRQRGDETARIEDALDDRQDVRVHRNTLVDLAVDEEIVDADGARPLEGVPRGLDVVHELEAVEVGDELGHERRLDRSLDDGEALTGDPLEVGVKRLHGTARLAHLRASWYGPASPSIAAQGV
jgi:hypothetical protein